MDNKLYMNITIADESESITLLNFPIGQISILTSSAIDDILHEIKWYMYGLYDNVIILNTKWTIIKMSKTKIELVRSNVV